MANPGLPGKVVAKNSVWVHVMLTFIADSHTVTVLMHGTYL